MALIDILRSSPALAELSAKDLVEALNSQTLDVEDASITKVTKALAAAGVFDEAAVEKLAAVGISKQSLAERSLGTGVVVTEDDVTKALADFGQVSLADRVNERCLQVRGQVANGSITTWEEAIKALGES